MRRRRAVALAVIPCALLIAVPVYKTLAGPASLEGEQEAVVYRGATACGVERWNVKTGMDGSAHLVNLKSITSTNIIHLRSLQPPSVLPARSRVRPVETTVFTLTAKLLRVKQEGDSDYHLVLSDAGGRTMIAEIPSPTCVGTNSPFLPSIRSVRQKFSARYHVTGAWQRPNVQVQVTGVGYFDFLHGQSGVAPNGIELHPVLAITFGTGAAVPQPPARSSSPPAPPAQRPVAGFSVRAWVSPSSMPYGAHPTLYAQTTPGASCTASVIYSTGRHPASFSGSAEMAGGNGQVSWTWHEETKGSGGEGDVSCSYRGQTKTAAASFSVNA